MTAAPLAGVRVVDLGRVFAGPLCAMLLGDLGADVIKVEPAPGGDFIRDFEPSFSPGVGSYFAAGNRNKRSILIDFRSDGGLKILRALLGRADVLVENFRTGVLDAMGFDGATLVRDYPRLVVTRIAAYGHTGPKKDLPGVDQIIQGVSGLMSVTGTAESGPVRCGIAVCDVLAGLSATIGTLAALHERRDSGAGQTVATSLLQATLGLMSVQAGRYMATDAAPPPEGNHHPVIAPYGLFPTADGHVQFNVFRDDQFRAFAALCGHPEWADDPRFETTAGRSKNKDDLRDLVSAATPNKTAAEWIDALGALGVPCGPVLDVKQAFEDEQAQALGMTLEASLSDGAPVSVPGFIAGLSRTPMALDAPPPLPGEHNEVILADIGLAEDPEARAAAGLT